MSECLPDFARHICQHEDGSWYGADHPNGPWRPIPAPQAGLPWKADGPAVLKSREPASVAADPTPLSPAAQAVLDAYMDEDRAGRLAPAAVLKEAADQVVPDEPNESPTYTLEVVRLNRMGIRCKLLAIAAELEGSNG